MIQELWGCIMKGEAWGLQGLIVRWLEACKPEIDYFNFQIVIFISE
jgi:hypothetical protein